MSVTCDLHDAEVLELAKVKAENEQLRALVAMKDEAINEFVYPRIQPNPGA